jgi:CBS domain-containing protein
MAALQIENTFFLSQILGKKVFWNGHALGKLDDLAVNAAEMFPSVTHIVVERSFGNKNLVIPFENVAAFTGRHFHVATTPPGASPEQFARYGRGGLALLRGQILNTMIVDMEDHEIEVVYDIRLIQTPGGLVVSDVDPRRASLLRRIGLAPLADWINNLALILNRRGGTISWKYVQPLSKGQGEGAGRLKLSLLKSNLADIHPVDLADILEELSPDQRLSIFNQLDAHKASDTLEEVKPLVQRAIISAVGDAKAAALIEDMTPAQAADVLSGLRETDADDILALIEAKDRAGKIESLLEAREKNILDFTIANYIKFLPETTVAEVLERYKDAARDADAIWYIYVVSTNGKLAGVADYHSILRALPSQRLDEIMISRVKSLRTNSTLAQAVQKFDKYLFRAMPVIDDDEILQGVVLNKDVVRLAQRVI